MDKSPEKKKQISGFTCPLCAKVVFEREDTAIVGYHDKCLADEAAKWNYSYEYPHNKPLK